jgi:predicted Zn-ribbon and HTH transcriptional regulator
MSTKSPIYRKTKLTIDQQRLALRLIDEGKTDHEIGAIIGCHFMKVATVRHRGDIQRELVKPHRCPECGYKVVLSPCMICEKLKAQEVRRLARRSVAL